MKLFSVFNILAAGLLILAVGMVAVPDASSRRILANEVTVVRTLQRLALAQVRFREAGTADRNGDGIGEFGFLEDLITSSAIELASIPRTDSSGRIAVAGYQIAAMLPDKDGSPVTRTSARNVDPFLARRSFLLVAVPTEPGRTGFKAYAVRHDLLVAQCDAAEPRWRGGSHPLPRLARLDVSTGQVLAPTTWRSPWIPFLPDIQAMRMIKWLEAEKLPVPATLSNLLETR